MKNYELLVIGFGKAGKTLAGRFAKLGKKVALVEENYEMYGGTCINIGCIPTKTMISATDKGLKYEQIKELRDIVTTRLRNKNYSVLSEIPVDIYHAKASFVSNKIVKITANNGEEAELQGEIIVINTGAKPNLLPILGLTSAKNVLDSTTLQSLEKLPQRLGILGGGNIGLEFAGLYSSFGSKVSVIDLSDKILGKEEQKISELARQYLEEQGVEFLLGTATREIRNNGDAVVVDTEKYGILEFDALLYATGRKPNIEGLGLENTDIRLTPNGAVEVNEFCETSVKNVFAVGDVNGGLQFTYTSLDDYRIVSDYLLGAKKYTLKHRKNIPYSVFIKPPLSRVGFTENQAKEQGFEVLVNELSVSAMPRAHVDNNLRGWCKVVIDKNTNQILGATLFCKNSEEIINIIKMAMDCEIPYSYFKSQIFTHPTMSENLNDLFAI